MNNKERLRTIICKHTSEMLDNPGECEIYPTSKFYNNLIEAILNAGYIHLDDVELDYDKMFTIILKKLDKQGRLWVDETTEALKKNEKQLIRKKEGV